MNLKQMAAAVTLSAAAAVATGADNPKHFDPYDLHNFNRHPQEIYEVTLTIHDAPGRLVPVDGTIGYFLNPRACLQQEAQEKSHYDYFQGVPLGINWLNRKIGSVYKTYVALDLMKDKDYFGRGMCHWVIEDFELYISNGINILGSAISFVSNANDSGIQPDKAVTNYFLKDHYLHPEKKGNDGKAFTAEEYLRTPESERSKFFYTTMSFKKVKPRQSLQRWIWQQYSPLIP